MTRRPFDLWLEFEHWLPRAGDDPANDAFNMEVTLADGRRYGLNVWTFAFLSRALEDCRRSGECLGGAYLVPPDLFVDRLDRGPIERVVADLIGRGGPRADLEILDPGLDP